MSRSDLEREEVDDLWRRHLDPVPPPNEALRARVLMAASGQRRAGVVRLRHGVAAASSVAAALVVAAWWMGSPRVPAVAPASAPAPGQQAALIDDQVFDPEAADEPDETALYDVAAWSDRG